jgi:hypothetical protein
VTWTPAGETQREKYMYQHGKETPASQKRRTMPTKEASFFLMEVIMSQGECNIVNCRDCPMEIDHETCDHDISERARKLEAMRIYIKKYGEDELKSAVLERGV